MQVGWVWEIFACWELPAEWVWWGISEPWDEPGNWSAHLKMSMSSAFVNATWWSVWCSSGTWSIYSITHNWCLQTFDFLENGQEQDGILPILTLYSGACSSCLYFGHVMVYTCSNSPNCCSLMTLMLCAMFWLSAMMLETLCFYQSCIVHHACWCLLLWYWQSQMN